MDDFDIEYYDSDTDPYSERNITEKACDIWLDLWMQGHELTPPYISMKHWYSRLGYCHPSDSTRVEIKDDTEIIIPSEEEDCFYEEYNEDGETHEDITDDADDYILQKEDLE